MSTNGIQINRRQQNAINDLRRLNISEPVVEAEHRGALFVRVGSLTFEIGPRGGRRELKF